ncbi:hypothetical protein [Pseudomonas sp. ZL2]
MKPYPLKIESVGEDTYIVMSRGHHDLGEFMKAAVEQRPNWSLGGPVHVWVKTTPGHGTYDRLYNFVPEGTRGAWPATYCFEWGEGYERYNEVQP